MSLAKVLTWHKGGSITRRKIKVAIREATAKITKAAATKLSKALAPPNTINSNTQAAPMVIPKGVRYICL